MKIAILVLPFCALLNSVTASSPFNIGNAKLQNFKPNHQSHTPKLPERRNFTSKAYDIKKSAKDYTNLLKGKPFVKTNDNKVDVIKEGNETINKEEKNLNLTKILYADEIETERPDNETQKIHEIKKEHNLSNFTDSNFPKKFSRNNESNKIGAPMKVKTSKDPQSRTLESPPSMIPIFKPNPSIARSQAKIENVEPISNVLMTNIPTQEAFIDISKNNVPSQDTIIPNPNAERSTVAIQDFIPDAARPVLPNEDLSAPVHNTAENLDNYLDIKGTKFDIPCQKASDVLEDIPKKSELYLTQSLEPKAKDINIYFQEQKTVDKLDKLETDDSVAIIFKPKNISLFNFYGDLLKKITLTVLVPYHISKLGT